MGRMKRLVIAVVVALILSSAVAVALDSGGIHASDGVKTLIGFLLGFSAVMATDHICNALGILE